MGTPSQIEGEDDDPEQDHSDHPLCGALREHLARPVALTGIETDPDRRRDDHENQEIEHCWEPFYEVAQRASSSSDLRDERELERPAVRVESPSRRVRRMLGDPDPDPTRSQSLDRALVLDTV